MSFFEGVTLMRSMMKYLPATTAGFLSRVGSVCLVLCVLNLTRSAAGAAEREQFKVGSNEAFVIMPPDAVRVGVPTPWVWYAPTLSKRHPNRDEQWMIDRLHAAGIALAGVDVGESYGSPQGVQVYQAFYQELTTKRGFSRRPVLLARSRGGLMLYSWAVANPESVAGIAGIYPVCNIASYPGIATAAPAFGLTADQLKESITQHNPIDKLKPLAKQRVPIFHIQGDSDNVVPHEDNTELLEKRYRALGGPIQVELIEGQGHNMWRGWFESKSLTRFMIKHSLGK